MRHSVYFLIGVLLAGCSSNQAPANKPVIQIPEGMRAYVASAPETLHRYRVDAHPLTDTEAAERARRFGVFSGGVIEQGAIVFKNGVHVVSVDRSMGLTYFRNMDRMWGASGARSPVARGAQSSASILPPARHHIPEVEVAKGIAQQYVRENGLAAEGEYAFYQVNEACQSSFDAETNSTSGKNVVQREVVFKRKLDGHVLHGSGSQISVFIGDGGSIDGVMYDWPTLVPAGDVEVIEPDVALSEVSIRLNELNQSRIGDRKIKEFSAQKIRLGYYASIHSDGSRDILPAYAVLGNAQSDKNEEKLIFLSASKTPIPSFIQPARPIQ